MNVVKNVNVVNFRSHGRYEVDFPGATTLVIGSNGSGKTSLLEAVYILLQGKSFRSPDVEILKKGEEFYRIELTLGDRRRVAATYAAGTDKKMFAVDGKKTARLPAAKKYPVVLFEPDDLHLVHSSPAKRRDFLDALIAQVDPEHHSILLKYAKALRQRGNLLKDEATRAEELFPWNQLLSEYAAKIVACRTALLMQINNRITELYGQIAGEAAEVLLKYKSLSQKVLAADYLWALENNFQKDKFLGRTTVGPHLDDVLFEFNGAPMVFSASRGEIRSAVLALKFIESGLIMDFTGKKPVVLLDDIFSELDEMRQRRLVDEFREHQVIITSVSAPPGLRADVVL